MTGFDETVPPEDDSDRDANATSFPDDDPTKPLPDDEQPPPPATAAEAAPEHDSAAPAFEDAPEPDEPA